MPMDPVDPMDLEDLLLSTLDAVSRLGSASVRRSELPRTLAIC